MPTALLTKESSYRTLEPGTVNHDTRGLHLESIQELPSFLPQISNKRSILLATDQQAANALKDFGPNASPKHSILHQLTLNDKNYDGMAQKAQEI